MTEQTARPALTGIESDIPRELAYRAHTGTSFSPERRAESEMAGWVQDMTNDYDHVMKHATTDEQRQELDAKFADYRTALLKRKLAMLASHSNIFSSMIAGPSNFPVARMEKRNRSYDNKVKDYLEFREKALSRMCNTYAEPVGIRTGEAGAVDALQAKIDKAESLQEHMKLVNKVIRKHLKAEPAAKVAALIDAGVTEAEAWSALKPDVFGGIGFASFELTNNNANIKRMKEQQAKAKKLAATDTSEKEIGAVKIVDNLEADRLQMFFPERTPRPIYDMLKSHGFRWTPSVGCFQAYRGANAAYWSVLIANEYNKETTP